jgi:hypothetical protein
MYFSPKLDGKFTINQKTGGCSFEIRQKIGITNIVLTNPERRSYMKKTKNNMAAHYWD